MNDRAIKCPMRLSHACLIYLMLCYCAAMLGLGRSLTYIISSGANFMTSPIQSSLSQSDAGLIIPLNKISPIVPSRPNATTLIFTAHRTRHFNLFSRIFQAVAQGP